jgi:CHASE3 domain sensor protein
MESDDCFNKTWQQISEGLRELQDTIDLYKKRFEAAARKDISDGLEECILQLITAEIAARELGSRNPGSPIG